MNVPAVVNRDVVVSKSQEKRIRRKEKDLANKTCDREGEYLSTRERAQQNGGVIIEFLLKGANTRAMVRRARARCECALDKYFSEGHIDKGELNAGLKYRTAWQVKAEGIRTSDSTEGQGIDDGYARTEEELMKRLNKVRWAERVLNEAHKEAHLTIGQALMVTKVCGSDECIGYCGHVRTLKSGLDKLARFWNFC